MQGLLTIEDTDADLGAWSGNGNYDAGQDRKSYQMQLLVFQKLCFRNSTKAKVVGYISIFNLLSYYCISVYTIFITMFKDLASVWNLILGI